MSSRKSYPMSPRERDTTIAALRLWQKTMERGNLTPDLMDIALNGRKMMDGMTSAQEIDSLIENTLNT
jgi:hypothetical protein